MDGAGSQGGSTALLRASIHGDDAVVALLLHAGAEVDASNKVREANGESAWLDAERAASSLARVLMQVWMREMAGGAGRQDVAA